jgi:seryl-tRNA synthetase
MTAGASKTEAGTLEVRKQIEAQEKELSSINSFLAIIHDWRVSLKRLDELRDAIVKTSEESGRIESEIKDLAGPLQQAQQVTANAHGMLVRVQESQSELQTLLDNISQYVTNEVWWIQHEVQLLKLVVKSKLR